MTEEEKIICKQFLDDADKTHSCNEYKLLMALLEQEPCKDCISREAVLSLFNNSDDYRWETTLIKKKIEKIPPVTPQEPRKGHWTEEFNDLEGEVRFTCSSCGKYQLFGTDFCYHCGSDNREVVEEC